MSVTRPPTAKGQSTAANILDAATRVLARDGMAGATLGRIADEAGVDKRNVTYYFSREALLVRVVQAFGERIATAIEVSIASGTSAPAEVMWSHITAEPQIPRAYISMLGSGDTEIDRALADLKDTWIAMLTRQLPTPSATTAVVIFALLRGLLLEWAETGDSPALADGLARIDTLLARPQRDVDAP